MYSQCVLRNMIELLVPPSGSTAGSWLRLRQMYGRRSRDCASLLPHDSPSYIDHTPNLIHQLLLLIKHNFFRTLDALYQLHIY